MKHSQLRVGWGFRVTEPIGEKWHLPLKVPFQERVEGDKVQTLSVDDVCKELGA